MDLSKNLVSFSRMRSLMVWMSVILLLDASDMYAQTFTLTPSVSLGERYDDNIFQTNDNEEDDFITVIAVGMRLHYVPRPETEFDFEYQPTLELFADHGDENQIAQRVSLTFVSSLTRVFSLSVSDELIITEEPGDRIVEIDETTGLRSSSRERRERTIRNDARAVLELQLIPRSTLGLLFDSLIEDVDVPEEVDEVRYTIGAELGYLVKAARDTRASLGGDVTFHTFSSNDGTDSADRGDFRVYTTWAGFRHHFSRTLSGRATIGYAFIDFDDSTLEGDEALVATLDITKALRTGSASFRYRREFRSGGGEGRVVLADRLIISVAFRVSSKITVDLRGNLSFFDFRAIGVSTEAADRRFWTIRPRLTYDVLRFWSVLVSYDYAFTDFDGADTNDRTEHQLLFTSRLALRERLFFDITYRYRSRQFEGGLEEDEFNRHQIMLTIVYAPTFFL